MQRKQVGAHGAHHRQTLPDHDVVSLKKESERVAISQPIPPANPIRMARFVDPYRAQDVPAVIEQGDLTQVCASSACTGNHDLLIIVNSGCMPGTATSQ